MKKIISYMIILILGILIGYLIINLRVNNNLKYIQESAVYIEAYGDETIKSGSGFVYKVIDNKNYIITSYHVVSGYNNIYIYNTSKKKEKATILAFNENADIAILSINDSLSLREINIGNSDSLEIGDDIYVLGTPLNMNYISTLSKGIVSFINREITVTTSQGKSKYNTIQVDAKVDEGNSGGPVLNNNGEVIGMMFVKEENVEGIGFALPINYVMDVVSDLKIK